MTYMLAGYYVASLNGRSWVIDTGDHRPRAPIYDANKRATKKRLLQSLRDRKLID